MDTKLAEKAAVEEAIAALKSVEGPLLPILHEIQDRVGHVPRTSIPIVADALHLSRAEVHGVVTFYHHFHREPVGRCVVQICRAEACQALGSGALEEHAQRSLGIAFGETTADGAVTLEAVFCLGNCATGPSVMIGDDIHGRVTAERFDALVRGGQDS